MGQRIKIRRDTAANWATANPILADGEQGYDKTAKKHKTGDGVTAWATLGWDKVDAADITNLPASFDGQYASLTGKPTLFDGVYASLTGKPALFDGAYASLTGKPDLTAIVIDGGAAAG